MSDRPVVFLDFDDTISDMRSLGPQYVVQLSIILAARFGGSEEGWAVILADELPASLARYAEAFAGRPCMGFAKWVAAERARVAHTVIRRMGLTPLVVDLSKLALQFQTAALKNCDALFPGVRDTLARLAEAGFQVHIASSQESAYLEAALEGAGIRAFVGTAYGPDLLDCAKEGPEFYEKLFRHAAVIPSNAVVIDDQPECLRWAAAAGARCIQARMFADSPPAVTEEITSLETLADLLLAQPG
jgi:phosphoglycolate phosphatase-like HAD superfamily hydrolase